MNLRVPCPFRSNIAESRAVSTVINPSFPLFFRTLLDLRVCPIPLIQDGNYSGAPRIPLEMYDSFLLHCYKCIHRLINDLRLVLEGDFRLFH